MTDEKRFLSDMASINADRAERMAVPIVEAGKSPVANYTKQAGQQKAQASQDIQKDLNMLNINANATRQAWEAREQAGEAAAVDARAARLMMMKCQSERVN